MNLFPKFNRQLLTSNTSDTNQLVIRRCATYLQNYSNTLSLKALKISLVVFCLLFTGTSMYVIISSFTHKKVNIISITPIRLPPHALDNYLNHLQDSTSGKQTFYSLLSARPGLIDSIQFLENIYLQQQIFKK